MDIVLLLARWALAAVLLLAATAKAHDTAGTRLTLRAFGAPAATVKLGAFALPALEAAVAGALLVAPAARLGGAASVVLLLVFSVALARAERSDGPTPPCHCFGQLGRSGGGRSALVRNAVLVALAFAIVLGGASTSAPWWASVAVAIFAVAAAAVAERRRPGAMGSRAAAWSFAAHDGGGSVTSAELDSATLLIFTSADCGPCHDLLADLPRWPLHAMPAVVVLAAGPAPAVDGVRVLQADQEVRGRYGIAATPGAVVVDERGRIASAPVLGSVAVETLARRWASGPPARTDEPRIRLAKAFGVSFEVAGDEEATLLAAPAALPPGTTIEGLVDADAPPQAARWTALTRGPAVALYRDGVVVGRAADRAGALELLAAAVRLHVAEHAPDHAFIHAGVVGWRGRAIVVPGRSFSGKSTFVTALLRAGATYFSDEYAVIDADGWVHPFAKLISLRDDGRMAQHNHDPAEFTDLPLAAAPLRLGTVLRAPYDADTTWSPIRASPGTGAMVLIENAVGIRAHPSRVMATIRAAVVDVVVLDAPRGEADETAEALLRHVDTAQQATSVSAPTSATPT